MRNFAPRAGTRRGEAATAWLLAWVLLAGLPLGLVLAKTGWSELGDSLADPALGRALGTLLPFSLAQAAGSLAVALVAGIPGAWIAARYRFPGRAALRALAIVPFSLPPVLVALGFVLYLGKRGALNTALMAAFGLERPPVDLLYSFAGLCLVQGFYNLPLVLDLTASSLERAGLRRYEAARSLGASRPRAAATAFLPAALPALVEASSLTFLFSFTSFFIVLLFGPLGAATLETEIFRAVRLSGDVGRGAALALVQTLVALSVLFLFALAARRSRLSAGEGAEGGLSRRPGRLAGTLIAVYFLFLLAVFLAPLIGIVTTSFTDRVGFTDPRFPSLATWGRVIESGLLFRSLVGTLATALPAALLASVAGLAAGSFLRGRGLFMETLSWLPLAVSGVVAAIGWRLALPDAGIAGLVLAQAMSALPFALSSSLSALARLSPDPARAARSLGAGPLRTLLDIEVRSMLPAFLSALGFSFALAAGDATTPLVFGLSTLDTLALSVYRLTGAYRFPEACALGTALGLASALAFLAKAKVERHG